MELLAQFIDIVLHLDRYLLELVQNHGTWVYLILFAIIYCETGLIVTPFLPGDSLLFVAGTLAAAGALDVHLLFGVLAIASFLGDNTNHWIGRFVGPKVFSRQDSLLFNRAYLDRTHAFYDKHGATTIVIARFMPIVRTFAPFVAGIARMHYGKFVAYSLVGSVFWISFFVYGGYFFGNIPWVKKNLTLVMIGIVLLSVLPGVISWLRARAAKN